MCCRDAQRCTQLGKPTRRAKLARLLFLFVFLVSELVEQVNNSALWRIRGLGVGLLSCDGVNDALNSARERSRIASGRQESFQFEVGDLFDVWSKSRLRKGASDKSGHHK